jgi:peptidyl-prolyl cis-trans isomerase B (cyclophilin B)
MNKKYFFVMCLPILFMGLTTGCGEEATPAGGSTSELPVEKSPSTLLPSLSEGAIQATIMVEGEGKIIVELFPDIAPQSVRNFVYLAKQDYYDGLTFHRIMSGFMIQGGCPTNSGTGNPG